MTLYEEDIVAWSEQQVAALRQLAELPALTNAVDWENVIEEIESLGRSQLETVVSLIENAFVHILKIIADPDSLSQRQWRAETAGFLKGARKRFKPSMMQAIDLEEIWREAIVSANRDLKPYDRDLPTNIPTACPFVLEDILDQAFDENRAITLLAHAAACGEHPE
jgi:hypothetical protein